MKLLSLVLSFVLLTASNLFAQGGTWETKASMPTARASHGVGVVNGILFAIGGNNASPCCDNPFLKTAIAYDPVTNTWTSVANMNLTRENHAAGVIDGILYAIGGDNELEYRGPIDAYNPASNTWTLKASIPTPRNFLAAGVSNGILYAIGGNFPSSTVVEAYDPTNNTWTSKASLLTPRHAPGAGVVDGILYAVGGYNPQTGQVLASVESYDPTTNAWTSRAPMPTPRVGTSVVVSEGILYAIGGHSAVGAAAVGSELKTVEAYDPGIDTWTTMTPMLTARGFFGTGVIEGKLYAVGGVDGNGGIKTTVEVFFDAPPIANAGSDFSVNEGQAGVTLDGSGSSDLDGDALTYAWTQVPGGTSVTLSGAATAMPSFTAPNVAFGGETLSFELKVTANGKTSTDTVSVTIVNVNHPPVADAGLDQSVAEGSLVTLHGENSFDIDTDPFSYAWVQMSGSPTVTLTGANTASPTFTAPVLGSSGAPGVVATLVFKLTVDDGYPQDAPAPGFTLANVLDTVTVEITNVNNNPTAAAGVDQTVNENSLVTLNGAASSDPDNDTLTYAWVQLPGGPTVSLSGANTANPSFAAPFVNVGGASVEFQLAVNDGYGGSATDTVVVNVQNINDPPLASAARPSLACLWPPNHGMVSVSILGVTDPNNNATITITGVTQDEPTNGLGDGDTPIDAVINANGTVLLRAERSGTGNGRVYRISFTASDFEGSSSGAVNVCVPHSVKSGAVDSGQNYNSTN